MSATSAKATPVRGGVCRAARNVPRGVVGTVRGGGSGGGAGVSVLLLGGLGPALVPWVETGGKSEEEEPSVVLGLGFGGGLGELAAGEEVPYGGGAAGLGCAWGERKTLGAVAGALRKELVVGEGAGGLGVLARRLPFAF